MAKVILGTTMSLDGFINDRGGNVGALYPDLDSWRYTEVGQESIQNTRAVVMGRNSFAMAEDPDSLADHYEYQVPIFVLTHTPPARRVLLGNVSKPSWPMNCISILCRCCWEAVCGCLKNRAWCPLNWKD